jgi:uncharacterized protein YecE (DUF72 family)
MSRPQRVADPLGEAEVDPHPVNQLLLGTAGWNVPSACRERIGGQGSHLERYSQALRATEINTSFYKPHRRETYERWARTTPDDFRFAVKVPKAISHVPEPQASDIEDFVKGAAGLGDKLAVFLVQFPPSRSFGEDEARRLFDLLQNATSVPIICEPRHASWFTDAVDQWLSARRISRVAADPSRAERADQPGGWQGLRYYRLHGSPRIYYSAYDADFLQRLAQRLSAVLTMSEAWCIFDNTALGAALDNALTLQEAMTGRVDASAEHLHPPASRPG